jgi:DNA-binding helix-hairpin-helix protein with protein kinase domain
VLRLLGRPGLVQQEIESSLGDERKQYQLEEFLEGILLRDALVPGVSLGDKTTLQSYGIETTADINEAALHKITGLGEKQVAALLAWRGTCETVFKFDASKPLSAALRDEIERRVQERMAALKEEALGYEKKLAEMQTLFTARLRLAQAQAAQVARQRDQAKVNISFLQEQLQGNV